MHAGDGVIDQDEMGAACAMLQASVGDDSCVAFEPEELLQAMVDADGDTSTNTIDENAFLRLMAFKAEQVKQSCNGCNVIHAASLMALKAD